MTQSRFTQEQITRVEAMGEMLNRPTTNETLQLPPMAAGALAASSPQQNSTTLTDAPWKLLRQHPGRDIPQHGEGRAPLAPHLQSKRGARNRQ